eukprot:Skav219844  [mRNA]  locus=scaffold859:479888:480244:- [translate_table: standard]
MSTGHAHIQRPPLNKNILRPQPFRTRQDSSPCCVAWMEGPNLRLSTVGHVDLFIVGHEEVLQVGSLLVRCHAHHDRFCLPSIETQDAAVGLVRDVYRLVLGHKQIACTELQLCREVGV